MDDKKEGVPTIPRLRRSLTQRKAPKNWLGIP